MQAVHGYDCLKGNNLEMFEVIVHGAMKTQKDTAAMMVLKIALCNSHIIMFVCHNREIYKAHCEYKQFIRQLKPNFMKDYSNTVEISVIKIFCNCHWLSTITMLMYYILYDSDLAITNFSVLKLHLLRSD